jgi:integrase
MNKPIGRHQGLIEALVLFFTGMRVSELCNTEVCDVALEACRIRVNQGKGSNWPFLAISTNAEGEKGPHFLPSRE